MQSLGYTIEDAVFGVWVVGLTLAVIRNIHHERTYISKNEPTSLVRRTNKGAVAFLLVVYALAPDFRATRGIYSSESAEFDLLYGYLAVCLLFASCVFIFSNLQAARVATSKTLHLPPESGPWKFYKYMHIVFPGTAFVVVSVAVALSQKYDTDMPIGIWHLVVCVIVVWEIATFLWYSIRLQRAIAQYQDQLYKRLHRSLRIYQIMITIPATVLVIGLAYFVPDNLESARRETRSEDEYNFSWALWMWCSLILESAFLFVAWVRPHHHSEEIRHKRAASEFAGADEEARKRRSRQFSNGSVLLLSTPGHKRGSSMPPSVAEGSEVEFCQINLAASPSNHSINSTDGTNSSNATSAGRTSTSEERLYDADGAGTTTVVVTLHPQTDSQTANE